MVVSKIIGWIREIVRDSGRLKIVSDGDLDGIFATGLLIRYLKDKGVVGGGKANLEYYYPSPDEIRGLVIENGLAIELPLTKGVVYRGKVLLIDHHNGGPRFEYYEDGQVKDRITYSASRSIAELVIEALSIEIDKDLLDAVNEVDQGSCSSELCRKLHRAYLLNITNREMRIFLTESVANHDWEAIKNWISNESKEWERLVEPRIEEFVKNASTIKQNIVYFTYMEENQIDKAARTQAMIRLEEKYPIVISIGLNNQKKVVNMRIATKKPEINLEPAYIQLREKGYQSGGRRNVGGAQCDPKELEEVIKDLKEIKWPM